MKIRQFFLLLPIVCFALSCKQQPADTKVFSFDYDDKMLKLIIFDGILNDSISLKVMFDTGGQEDYICLSDSLAQLLDTTVYLQIGTYQSLCSVFAVDRNNSLFRHFDAIVGWKFFDDKIIEISYQHKYVRELDTIPVSSDFSPARIEITGQTLRIPIKVYIHGKCIEENFSLDTGHNGDITLGKHFIDKYTIDLTDAYHGSGQTVGGVFSGCSIPADSIVLGKYALPDISIGFITANTGARNRLLGNRVLEHFTVILDLKNYYLYLKPNEKTENE